MLSGASKSQADVAEAIAFLNGSWDDQPYNRCLKSHIDETSHTGLPLLVLTQPRYAGEVLLCDNQMGCSGWAARMQMFVCPPKMPRTSATDAATPSCVAFSEEEDFSPPWRNRFPKASQKLVKVRMVVHCWWLVKKCFFAKIVM